LLIANCSFGQEKAMGKEASGAVQEAITRKAKSIGSLETNFKQIKHLEILQNDVVSEGRMYIKAPDKINWSYLNPFEYTAIFNKNKLYINDNGNKSSVNLGSTRSFTSLNEVIMKSVRGDMFDRSLFDYTFFQADGEVLVKFVPKEDNLRQLIPELHIYFDNTAYTVSKVKMKESDNDYTLLIFHQQKYNISIPDEVFTP
jgi:outer membrane lipoprotein-sorting protein